MNKNAKIYVAGHRGLVGSALVRRLKELGYENLLLRDRQDLDLREQVATRDFLRREKPDYIFIAAAKVGGIQANNLYRADFMSENLMIECNVINGAWAAGIERLLFLGSSCIYPRDCPQPIKEEYLLTGPLEPTNEPYALAKIAGLKLCESFNRQYGTKYLTVMPTNLYGPGDNYDPENSHVLPALLRKIHAAKESRAPSLTVWGSGAPKREFLYIDDLAEACVHLMERDDIIDGIFNIGCGHDLSINELAQKIMQAVDYQVELRHDSSKPDGTPRKLLDVSKMAAIGWRASTSLEDGLKATYADYLANVAD